MIAMPSPPISESISSQTSSSSSSATTVITPPSTPSSGGRALISNNSCSINNTGIDDDDATFHNITKDYEARIDYAASLCDQATDILVSTASDPATDPSYDHTQNRKHSRKSDDAAIDAYKKALCILKDLMLELDGGDGETNDDDDDDDTKSMEIVNEDENGDDTVGMDVTTNEMDCSYSNHSPSSSPPTSCNNNNTDWNHPSSSSPSSSSKSQRNPVNDNATHSRRSFPVLRMSTHPFRTTTTTTATTSSRPSMLDGHNDQIYIYQNLIRFRPSGDVRVDTNLLSAIIIFNMAIIYHHHGHASSHRSSSSLPSSSSTRRRIIQESDLSSLYGLCLQLYDMSLILVERILSSPDMVGWCEWECLFLRMVCLNNMAQASYENREYVQSRYLLDVLQTAMREDEAVSKIFLDETDIHGIILNCILLHPPTAAEAA